MKKQVDFRIPLRFLTLLMGLFLSLGAYAQITVNGLVKDATGEPVIGASVRVVGTQQGTATDFDGNFTLKNVAEGAQLQISYVGAVTQTVTAAPNVVVTLEDNTTVLNDVVVIGYGRAKKSDLTGSVTAIKPDELNHGLQTNAQDMITGKIAGVSVVSQSGAPGANSTIRIRGGSSLNASNNPLIVIDGLAMDNEGMKDFSNPLALVNPNDIESFTVLKDASATAIYGSRASNGVIIITTKKGAAGQKPKVSYAGNVSFSSKKKTLDVMSGPEFMQFVENMYGKESDAYNALGYLDASGNRVYADTDWQDQIYRTAVSTDHNITVSGGLSNMPYRVSFGYTNNQGIVKTSSFERYTGSFSVSPTLLQDHLRLNINGKGMIAKNRYNDGGVIGAAVYMDPTKAVTSDNPIYNNFGGYVQWYQAAEFGDSAWPIANNRNATSNPVADLNLKDSRTKTKSLVGNIEADYKIHGFEDLRLHVNAGMDFSRGESTNVNSRYAYSNQYFGWDGWGKKNTYNTSLSMYAQYMKELNSIHNIDIMAGYEWQHFKERYNYDGYGTYPSTSPNAGEKYNAPTTETRYRGENYLVSFFGRLNYNLMDRYLLTFTLRDDGSSRFHKDNRWGVFPSAALAWRFKEESFLKDVTTVNDAKLRLGWGITGQQEGIGNYTYIPTYTPNQGHAFYFGDESQWRPDAYNRDLTWEKTTTWNAGVDLAFLNDRLVFNLDYYYRKTKDLINTVYVSAGSNFKNRVTSNIGSLHNSGLEFAATVRPVKTSDWQWELTYNFTYNKNEIDELVSGEGDSYFVETGGIAGGTGGNIQAHAVGHAASSFYVYQQAYDANGKIVPNTYVDRNGDGIINSQDKYFYYKPAADVLMGLSSKLQYRNWDFSFSMRASLGNYVYNNNLSKMQNVGSASIYVLGYLSNRSKDAVALGLTNPLTEQLFSDYYVQNASFLKMDNITLGYSFNNLLGSKLSGRAYVTAQNVFTITNYDGIDPEVDGGIDNSMYPRPFTTVLGVTLNF